MAGYNVGYVTNGGYPQPANVDKVTAIPVPLPTVTRTGHIFAGWFFEPTFVTRAVGGETIAKDTTLYAKWIAQQKVTYNSRGGTEIPSQYVNGYLPSPLPLPIRDNYRFDGWFYDELQTHRALEHDAITTDVTLYAKWSQYQIGYVTNGGTAVSNDKGTHLPSPLPTTTKIHNDFLGWFYDPQFSVQAYPGQIIYSDVTLYAKWKQLYLIEWSDTGDTILTDYYADKLPDPMPTVTKNHYRFVKWVYYSSTTEALPGTVLTEDVKIAGTWENFEVSFNSHGGSAIPSYRDVKLSSLPTPTKAGDFFGGWYYSSTYTVRAELDDPIYQDTILHAKWGQYVITYQSNGGTPIPSDSGVNLPTPLPVPEKESNQFVGWFYNPSLTQPANAGDALTSDVILYAKWQPYTATWHPRNGDVDFYTYGDIPTPLPTPVRENYKLQNWYYDVLFTQTVQPGDHLTGDVDCYAQWIQYQIGFVSNGGTPVADAEGTNFPAPMPTPTRTNYFLVGWFYDNDTFLVPAVGGELIDESYIHNNAVTVYAKWGQHTVRYVTNGGTPIPDYHGTALPNPLPVPQKEELTFAGWYYDAEFQTPAVAGTTLNADVILYAKWVPYSGPMKLNLYQNGAESNVVDKTNNLKFIGTVTGTMRTESSMQTPTIFLELDAVPEFNYVFIPNFARYYYVRQVTLQELTMYRIDLQVDVLMSFRDDIINTEAFVLRNEFRWDELLTDTKYPLTSIMRQTNNPMTFESGDCGPWTSSRNIMQNDGFNFVIEIFAYSIKSDTAYISSEYPMAQIVTNARGVAGFVSALQTQLFSKLGKFADYVSRVYWLPFEPGHDTNRIKEIEIPKTVLGTESHFPLNLYNAGTFYAMRGNETETVWKWQYYRDDDMPVYKMVRPYRSLQAVMRPFGNIDIDEMLYAYSADTVYVRAITNNLSGDTTLYYGVFEPGGIRWQMMTTGNVLIDIPIGIQIAEPGQFISALGTATTGMIGSNPAAIASGVMSMVSVGHPNLRGGVYKSIDAVPEIIVQTRDCITETPQFHGRPLMESIYLRDLHGYTVVGDIHFGSRNATWDESNMIVDALQKGVIL